MDNNEKTGIVIIYPNTDIDEIKLAKVGYCPVCKTGKLSSTMNSVTAYCSMCDKLICVDFEGAYLNDD